MKANETAKPDDIPQDVWSAAKAVIDATEGMGGGLHVYHTIVLSRSLIAERERAAVVVEAAAAKYLAASIDTFSVADKLRLDQAHKFLTDLALSIRTGETP